jgi:dihydroorotase
MKILIRNGHIVDPSQDLDMKTDILIDDRTIIKIGKDIAEEGGETSVRSIDATGLYVLPGMVDMHVHLREPGYEYKETIRTGTGAAVRGGFTSVCCMPNTKPVNDNETVTEFILRKTYAEGACYVFPIGAVSKGQHGKELAEMGMMRDAGCVAFSDDGHPVMNGLIMRRALEYSKTFGVPIISHAEDSNLSSGGVMNEGALSALLGLRGIPRESEIVMIKRDIDLARLTDGRLHIAHVSTAEGVDAIRMAKKSGVNVTAETCPHYFSITEETARNYNTYAKVNPPLRTDKDIEAIKEGLADGTIDVITTDHAPHHFDEKSCEFDQAAPGISGLETALSLCLRIVDEGVLSLSGLARKMSLNPSLILGLNKGTLKERADADVVLVSMDREVIVDSKRFISKGKNTPFNGMRLKGRPVMTICRGFLYDLMADEA